MQCTILFFLRKISIILKTSHFKSKIFLSKVNIIRYVYNITTCGNEKNRRSVLKKKMRAIIKLKKKNQW